jgi:hypothetical protein
MNGKRLLDDQGRTLGWRGALTDVTERVASQQRLQQLAHTDSLTGLANRHTLRAALASALRRAARLACSRWTWTTSRPSTTAWATPPATRCSRPWRQRLRGCMRPAIWWPGSAATSSRC